ncbi:hypothetical protein BpHYR1_037449 [Brachionus plicatilis]|uniref:Uncharacterized protein n=1 Tax=Brachionus plicatilis TaxID=10195 RepID=A0A3M7SF62_BRAPC|nr:hypothetical protein BpHYR1_037449 [Brachionus plicatilis]
MNKKVFPETHGQVNSNIEANLIQKLKSESEALITSKKFKIYDTLKFLNHSDFIFYNHKIVDGLNFSFVYVILNCKSALNCTFELNKISNY